MLFEGGQKWDGSQEHVPRKIRAFILLDSSGLSSGTHGHPDIPLSSMPVVPNPGVKPLQSYPLVGWSGSPPFGGVEWGLLPRGLSAPSERASRKNRVWGHSFSAAGEPVARSTSD
jgi:hypothetical protein